MNNLNIKGDWKSPSISLNSNGNLELWGRSLPENALDIYNPIFDWLDEYKKNPAEKTIVAIKLEYFNTTSSKLIYSIFKKFEDLNNAGSIVSVKWYYENDDPDLEEEGKLLKKITNEIGRASCRERV